MTTRGAAMVGSTRPDDDESFREGPREVREAGARRLQDLKLSKSVVLVAKLTAGTLRAPGHKDLLPALRTWRRDLQRVDEVLADTERDLLASERTLAEADPLGEVWWRQRMSDIEWARQSADVGAATRVWIESWVRALFAEQWSQCEDLTALSGSTPGDAALAIAMSKVADALAASAPHRAEPPLRRLLIAGAERLGTAAAVELGVLHSRVLYRTDNSLAAIKRAHETVSIAAGSDAFRGPLRALAAAVRVEAFLAADDLQSAVNESGRSSRLEGTGPDLYLARAAVAEQNGDWDRVDEQYAAAIEASGTADARVRRVDITRPQLLRPVPGRLLWLLSRQVPEESPQARLDLVEEALAAGVQGEQPFPQRHALLERADLLADVGRPLEAGSAYLRAGIEFSGSGSAIQARKLLRKACDLAPDIAEHHWAYAEALRAGAVDSDGVVNRKFLERALTHLKTGSSRSEGGLGSASAWVLLTEGATYDALEGLDVDATLWCERALLLEPLHVVSYAFLATFLRRRGYAREACEVARRGLAIDYEPTLGLELVSALADRGEYEQALRETDKFLTIYSPEDVDYRLVKAIVQARLGRHLEALETLSLLVSDRSRLPRANCLEITKSPAARAEYASIWADRRSFPSRIEVAWAAFRIGRLDEAIGILRELSETTLADNRSRRDLGIVLIARGEIDEGAALLNEAIRGTMMGDRLVSLKTYGLPLLEDTLDPEHMSQLTRQIDVRIAELEAPHPHDRPSEFSARAATAGILLENGELEEAAALYTSMINDNSVPEAVFGLRRAAQTCLDQSDQWFSRDEDLEAARRGWNQAFSMAQSVDDASSVLMGAQARLMLAGLISDGETPAPEHLGRLIEVSNGEPSPLEAAVALFTGDVEAWWRLHDWLTGLTQDSKVDSMFRRTCRTLAHNMPMADAYGLRRSNLPDAEAFPLLTAIEVRLGSQVSSLASSSALNDAIAELVDRLHSEMGVRIPVPAIDVLGDRSSTRVEILVYEQVMRTLDVSRETPVGVEQIVEALELLVRGQLYRLITADDLGLWLAGWTSSMLSSQSTPSWVPQTASARLRVVRILRLLLREGVPVVDRDLILDVCRPFEEEVGKEGPAMPLTILRAVRRRLGPGGLSTDSDSGLVDLPRDLVERALAGIDPVSRARWEMDRTQAVELVRDLRSWLEGHGNPHVVVEDAILRPFLWRLLAGADQPNSVFTKEELR
jgi:tetratricopeptide (TPR) repeat protein